jgi:hypothetical protein
MKSHQPIAKISLLKTALTITVVAAMLSCAKKENDITFPKPKGVTFKLVSISEVPSKNPNGHPWHTDGSGPNLEFSMDDNNGNYIIHTNTYYNTYPNKTYTFSFSPYIKIDTIINRTYNWQLYDNYGVLGPNTITESVLSYDWPADSLILSHANPRIVMQIEYKY